MYRTLVFPSCNEPGLEIVRALLKSNKVQVLGGSSNDILFDPSRLILKNHLQCPNLDQRNFRENFSRLIAAHHIDTVFPATDSLVKEFSTWRIEGVNFITTNPETAKLVSCKSGVYARLAGWVPVPRILGVDEIQFPAYAKPDCGAGSRGHRMIRNQMDWAQAGEEGLLITEYLSGKEYTVDCINDMQGNLLFAGPRLRGIIGRGIALGTKTLSDRRIHEYIRQITQRIQIEGPWFAQFKENDRGEPVLLEINARVGGSMLTTRMAGVNIPLMALFLFKGFKVTAPAYATGTVVNRCLANLVEIEPFDCVLWDLDDTIIRKDAKPDPDAIAALFDCRNRGIKQLLLTKNPAPQELLAHHGIPASLFIEIVKCADKFAEIGPLLLRHGVAVQQCVAVNDSNLEKLFLQRMLPGLRIIGPEDMEVLGRERL